MYAALILLFAVACIAPASAGPPPPNEAEVSCFALAIRGKKAARRYVCMSSSRCWRTERELSGHEDLRVVASCKETSPLWCYTLAPRGEVESFTSCQPTLAACRFERAIDIKDAGRPNAKHRDTRCTRREDAPADWRRPKTPDAVTNPLVR